MEIKVNIWHILLVLSLIVVLVSFMFIFYRLYVRRILEKQQEKYDLQMSHQRELFNQSLEVQETERKRISSYVHDVLGNNLMVLSLWIKNKESFSNETYEQKIDDQLTSAIEITRKISHDLFPSKIEFDGLVHCIRELFSLMNHQIKTSIHLSGEYRPLPFEKEVQIYRIVQEFINNTIKHGKANNLNLCVRSCKLGAVFIISDDGQGFDVEKIKPGLGLNNIATRVSIFEGHYKIKSQQGKGTSLLITTDYGAQN